MRRCLVLATLGCGLLAAAPARTALAPATFPALAFEQHPGAPLPGDAELVGEDGRAVRLSALITGRPVLVVLEYLRCPNLCGLVLGGLLDGLARTPLGSGRDYDVLAIGIDPDESSAAAGEARRDYTARYGPAALVGWRFLTGREPEVRRIADAIGFPYRYDAAIGQYAHPAGVVAATPGGRVSRYLFGVAFDPLDLRLALTEASEGAIAAPAARLLLLCYGYDPASGSYTFALMSALRAAGLATVAAGATLMWRQFRRDARRG